MATKNEDGSVTLTEQEFQCCAAFLELPANEFFTFLNVNAQGTQEGFTVEHLTKKIIQHHQTANCAIDVLPN